MARPDSVLRNVTSDDPKVMARQLAEAGWGTRRIARELGAVSHTTVWRWLNPSSPPRRVRGAAVARCAHCGFRLGITLGRARP